MSRSPQVLLQGQPLPVASLFQPPLLASPSAGVEPAMAFVFRGFAPRHRGRRGLGFHQPKRGRPMGSEVGKPITAKLAPHRRYVRVATDPEARGILGSILERGLYDGEPPTCRRRLLPFARTMLHLVLLLAVFKRFQVEGRAFQELVQLAALALPLHYLAPFRWKKPLFVATSIAGLLWVFGPEVGGIVLGAGTALVGICYLPIPWGARVSILGATAAVLAVLRGHALLTGSLSPVWPVLASMMMFRMMIYLYELKHSSKQEPVLDTANYFLLLPNFCFMHFPVVDYRTLQRAHFSADVHAIQWRGLQMMLRGTIHLLCYRVIDQEFLLPASEVHGPWALAGFLVWNYLLYLQVSGQFHVACGLLHLFGYQLPETHHHYLLATGFTDYWRRINIYWKDFMVRLVFNPVVFRLKRWSQPAALAVATMAVFVTTWVLHAYQKYWLCGTWGFSVPDALFWGILGVFVMVNVQCDARRSQSGSRARRAGAAGMVTKGQMELGPLAIRALKTVATFVTIAVLWSLWSSPSLAAWLDLLRRGLSWA